jgi:glycosyltransferase involved in cell wall biosynthesis
MLSIIICSRSPWMLETLRENIAMHVGVPFEVIGIDNRDNTYGICKAYNMGADQAKYPYLCFMHEDVLIETPGWGERVIQHLTDQSIGLIGIAGGDAKSLVPSSWSIPLKSCEINVIQHFKDESKIPFYHLTTGDAHHQKLRDVLILDGVWLCTRKDVFQQYRFDEVNFTGFHGYDIDYSLQVTQTCSAKVMFDISIHHYSEGNPDKQWMDTAIRLSKKWSSQLPRSIHQVSKKEFLEHHWKNLYVFIEHLFRLHYSRLQIISYFHKYALTRYFLFRGYISLLKHILKKTKKNRS